MGCGQKACADDQDDHERYMKATGLDRDKKYGNIQVYSADASVVRDCARNKLSKEETIKSIIHARHKVLAENEFKKEMEERRLFSELSSKY